MEFKKENINVRKTVEKSVAGRSDFHFHVDELTSRDYMPTYAGMADEKYSFDEMDDAFFEFLERKMRCEGIYIRIVFACSIESDGGKAAFKLQYGDESETFMTDDAEDVLLFEFADFGVKIRDGEATFGATVEGGCGHTPYFAEFGSHRANEQFISLQNPLNRRVIEIMEDFVELDE